MPSSQPETPKKVNLALQGGGAHGAFTWGVLDYLLESRKIEIDAISGTSAGAMNAVVAADGLMAGGREGARAALRRFWTAVSRTAVFSAIQRTPFQRLTGGWNIDDSPGYLFFDFTSRLASPYQLNPLKINPLRDLLVEQVDFARVRSCDRMQLFISATSVRNGQVKVFDRRRLTADMVMASACLPQVFQAVTVDGEDYWDGGYAGNPVLFPFAYRTETRDIVIVQINPLTCRKTPTDARQILDRVNEITFNASLMAELRAIEFVGRLLDKGALDPDRYHKMLIHVIHDPEGFAPLDASSKMNAEKVFLEHLFDMGRRAAGRWLAAHFDRIGREPSIDLRSILHGCAGKPA
ncbi:patatin-like phospholipase family protein [Desulfococcus sp.]|uniref:patatin-like phospholipase family protein n=1 Tax=Desulfococcus sp. TaxID=2025834 RepID=UPI0035940372